MKRQDRDSSRGVWADVRAHLRYRFDQVISGGWFAQLGLLAGFTALSVLFGMGAMLVGLFDEENRAIAGIGRQFGAGPVDALWWSAKHVFDPSFFDYDYGATWPVVVISLVVSVLGMSVFATMLGFISSGIEGRMAALRKGGGVVKEVGHVLILGWSDKVISILELLEDRQEQTRVVILSQHSIEQMTEVIRVCGRKFRSVRTILRTGSPASLVELKRVAFESAFSIIVLADESAQDTPESVDIRTIKTLLQLVAHCERSASHPKIVAEISSREHLQAAEIAANGYAAVMCSSTTISKVAVQTSRQPGFSRVYAELFGFAGNEIYIREFPACVGREFRTLRAFFRNAIPIGVSRASMQSGRQVFAPQLNPGEAYVVQPGEWIVCVAQDETIECDPLAPADRAVAPFSSESLSRKLVEQVLILGWNDELYDVLQEFDRCMIAPTNVYVAAAHPEERAAQLLRENLTKPLRFANVKYQRLDYSRQSALAKLPVADVEHLIILADESSEDPEPDSRTLMTVLSLRTLNPGLRTHTRVVVEIVNADNCELLQREQNIEFVVSPEIVSMLLTQISQQLMLQSIYQDLLSAGGTEIYLRPAGRYVKPDERCGFEDIATAAAARREVAIGLKLAHQSDDAHSNFGVLINPPRGTTFELTDDDKVIVVASATVGEA